MKNLNTIFKAHRKFIVSGLSTFILAYMVMFYAENLIKGDTPYGALELQLSTESDQIFTILETWGQDGKLRFLKFMGFDYAYALAYSFFLYYLLRFFNRNYKSWVGTMYVLPFVVGLLDIIENTIEIGFVSGTFIINNFSENTHQWVVFMKWVSVIAYFAVLFVLLVYYFAIRVKPISHMVSKQ